MTPVFFPFLPIHSFIKYLLSTLSVWLFSWALEEKQPLSQKDTIPELLELIVCFQQFLILLFPNVLGQDFPNCVP